MNEIMKSFEHEYFGEIRTLTKEGEPWFVAKDVALVLGYSNPHDAIRRFCKGVSETRTPTAKGMQTMKIIPERDLYRLIMRSRLPQAERFEEWVVGEVLPSIRKHGGYLTPQKLDEVLDDPDTLIKLATNLKIERQRRLEAEAQRLATESQLEAVQPKVEFAEALEVSEDTILVRELAKLIQQTTGYKTGGNRFYRWLRDNGYPELLPDWRAECSS
ncbi:phage antirepressor [Halodesulfovibrio sp.]|jgi:anti-repressor protein|uniref:phage antirepressor n=1 Tax=Halodesulfovibrio sp. TaxID=1912772 RepID=UPI0025FD45F9|nr:phage antirepressor [Halodesulfovibrio sp.]MCT4627240.1 phage antirepressor [Halodesulfovibrio sp.]